jgi:hypothetical protein
MHDALSRSEPSPMNEGHEWLTALYRTLKALEGKDARA